MAYLGIFRVEFQKTFVIFEISTLEFVYLQNFAKNQKCLNLGPKIPYMGIFGIDIQKLIFIYEISTLEFV